MYTVYNVYIPHFQTNTRIGMSQVIQIMCSPTAHISPPAEPVLAEPVASVRWEKRIGRDAVTCYQQCYLFSHVSNFLSFLQFPSSVPSIRDNQSISEYIKVKPLLRIFGGFQLVHRVLHPTGSAGVLAHASGAFTGRACEDGGSMVVHW